MTSGVMQGYTSCHGMRCALFRYVRNSRLQNVRLSLLETNWSSVKSCKVEPGATAGMQMTATCAKPRCHCGDRHEIGGLGDGVANVVTDMSQAAWVLAAVRARMAKSVRISEAALTMFFSDAATCRHKSRLEIRVGAAECSR